ncbi:uncharacterized protein LOC132747067 [Ruditapes philippinarum]|uniref:uncharacterized protein LOC132747067 n=1 Tax=Ruditapes philippinarum TaxID=129788 RepID=UPI00295AB831|nr:uncharacterized protein LOC132747067 [Ruditapes philippinarum]
MLKEIGVLFFFKLVLICVVESSCPLDWSLSEVMKCLKNITYGVNGTNILAGTDTTTIRKFCTDGTLNHSVECLDNLYSNCGPSESLVKMAVPKLWRSSIDKLCSSLSEHAVYSTCIVHLRPKIKSCLIHNDKIFQGSIRPSDTWKTLKIKICGYFEGMRICTSRPVIDDCDDGVGNTLSDFMSSIAPHMCYTDDNYMNAGSQTAPNTYLFNSTCYKLLSLLSFWWAFHQF